MRHTPLFDEHVSLGAKMVDFAGWALPLQFAGILKEHHHTRARVSLFDCSHMGEFRIRGARAIEAYDALVTSDIAGLPVGRARYGALLNDQGGFVDDLISMRLAEDDLLVVTNAGPLDKVSAIFTGCVPGAEDLSSETAKIDVQGPCARRALAESGIEAAAPLKYFGVCSTQWRGAPMVVARAGYTGELGYELYLPAEEAPGLWRELLAHSEAAPAGLGARDTLRLEMGYPLSGQDIGESRTPLEARQDAFVHWESRFVGKDALLEQRARGGYDLLTPVRTGDRRAPRHGYDIYLGESRVGEVTSGACGPSVGYGIGLAYLPRAAADAGNLLTAGPKAMQIEVGELPFYRNGTCRM